jgi:hypothetical protein
MITETAEVERALAPLRAKGAKIDFGRLVVLGARAQVAEIEDHEEDRIARLERQRLAADEIRDLVDPDVLLADEAWR